MSATRILLALALFAFLCTASAHGLRSFKGKRAALSSTCSQMQCAVSHGNCGLVSGTIQFCQAGEHCNAGTCSNNVALGAACNPNADENECAQGSCVNNICQLFQEIMPGNPCSNNSQCYFSQTADGSGSAASTCDATTKTCFGHKQGEACLASHQCVSGLFCSSGMICQSLGQKGDSCSNDNECSDRFTCFSGKCGSRFTQSAGQQCNSNDNCQDGLYCKSGSCAAVKTSSSGTSCDIASNNCLADEECKCQGFTSSSKTASCSAIKGTTAKMSTIEQSAFSCVDKYNCGSDLSNSSTISCISTNCQKDYCTYIASDLAVLFTEFPSCLSSRMVSTQFSGLLTTCAPYVNAASASATSTTASSTTSTDRNSATTVAVSFVMVGVAAFAALF